MKPFIVKKIKKRNKTVILKPEKTESKNIGLRNNS